jgi:hypothetical protein
MKKGPPNKERGDGVGDGLLQSHSGVNLNPNMAKNRGSVPKGGEADGVALTEALATELQSARQAYTLQQENYSKLVRGISPRTHCPPNQPFSLMHPSLS